MRSKVKKNTVLTFVTVGSVRRAEKSSNSQKVLVNIWEEYCVSTKVTPEKVKARSQKVTRK